MASLYQTDFSPTDLFSHQTYELRRNYMRVLLWGVVAILTLATMRAAAWRDAPGLFHTWQVAVVLAAGLFFTSMLMKHHVRMASWVIIITLIGANTVEGLLFPHDLVLYFFAVIGVNAALLHSERGAAILISLNLACVIGLGFFLADVFAPADVIGPALITLLVSAAAWLGTHQLYIVMQWEWHSTQQSMLAARKAQDHRAELMRLNKEIDSAYLRLERMNRMLILARKEAQEATALKIQFANSVSHELRSPINMILGFSDMMVNSPEVYGAQSWDPRLRHHIQQIYQSSQHLSQLIDDVLDMARIDAYRLSLVKAPTQVEAVIAESCEITQTLFEARHLYLKMDVEPALPAIFLDQTRIRQVLLNLLTNAVRFTHDGGVTIRAYRDQAPHVNLAESSIIISVTDTGIGIDAADLPKIFEEYGQLENIYRWKRGAGLGLFISKQLIELHSGRIWVESEPGAGTTFFISLPLTPADAVHGLAPVANQDHAFWSGLEQRAHAQRTLLVLGDDPKIKRLLTAELSSFDVTWLPADCAEQTWLSIAANAHPSAILRITGERNGAQSITLSSLPQITGIPLVTCSLPGLFQTSTPRYLSNYLVKPISRRRLADALAKLKPGQKRIQQMLIVDDDEAGDGETALRLTKQVRPDVILLDLNLPDIDGFDLAERIHAEIGDGINIIAVTARELQSEQGATQHDIITCAREKPFSRHELGVILANMIGSFSANTALPIEPSHQKFASVDLHAN